MGFFKKTASKKETAIERIPGIEPQGAQIIRDLGFRTVEDLKQKDAEELYYQLCTGQQRIVDKSILYQLRCAIYYASVRVPDPKKLRWWYWKDSDANETMLSEEDLLQIYGRKK